MSSLLTTFLNGFVIVVLIFSALIERNELRAQGFAPVDQPALEEILNSPNPELYRPNHRQGFDRQTLQDQPGDGFAEPDWDILLKDAQQWVLVSIIELGQEIMHRHSPPMYPLAKVQERLEQSKNVVQVPEKQLTIAPYREPIADLSL